MYTYCIDVYTSNLGELVGRRNVIHQDAASVDRGGEQNKSKSEMLAFGITNGELGARVVRRRVSFQAVIMIVSE